MNAIDPNYPRPNLRRADWLSLDGRWDFATGARETPDDVTWSGSIVVPYPPESLMAGVEPPSQEFTCVWYRRGFQVPESWAGQRVLLHFGAVDYAATVWLNGRLVASHEGGHTPFQADVTSALRPGAQEVVVRAEDAPAAMDQPRGKQDWLTPSHHIWYPRTTGIWQPVWLEPVPAAWIAGLHFTPDVQAFAIDVDARVAMAPGLAAEEPLHLDLELRLGERLLAATSVLVTGAEAKCRVHLRDPGIYHARNEFMWSPERPVLLDVRAALRGGPATPDRDVVETYAALRSVGTSGRHFTLNGRAYFLRMALDQGIWRESHLAAPDGLALRREVELAKALGFNGVRKHQKIEDPRYLFWADVLGLLVWEELPSAYRFSAHSATRLVREWMEVIERDRSHPCIVTWVTFNESWGVPDVATDGRNQDLVRTLYHLTRTLDPTRLVIGNDGWEHVVGDVLSLHDYSPDPSVIARRYATPDDVRATIAQHPMHGRAVFSEGNEADHAVVILSEFGGIRLARSEGGWGYTEVGTPQDLLERYASFVAAASAGALAGFCYTQFCDTFQEQNGLLYEDRSPKADLAVLAAATRNEPREEPSS